MRTDRNRDPKTERLGQPAVAPAPGTVFLGWSEFGAPVKRGTGDRIFLRSPACPSKFNQKLSRRNRLARRIQQDVLDLGLKVGIGDRGRAAAA